MNCKNCKQNKKCHFATRNKAKKIRKDIWEILINTNKSLGAADLPKFGFRIVGSSKRNMVFQHGNDIYDTDIQLELRGKKAVNLNANFKETVKEKIKENLPNKWTAKLSTSVITINKVVDGDLEHYFDLAIIRISKDKSEIIRGKNGDKSSNDYYKWNELPKYNDAYNKWKNINTKDRAKIKEAYLNKKCEMIGVDKDSSEHKSSARIFIETVNEIS